MKAAPKPRNNLVKQIREASPALKWRAAIDGLKPPETLLDRLAEKWATMRQWMPTPPPYGGTFSVFLNRGFPYEDWDSPNWKWPETPNWTDAAKRTYRSEATAELSKLASLAMLRGDAGFFRELAEAMEREPRPVADPERAHLLTLLYRRPPLEKAEVAAAYRNWRVIRKLPAVENAQIYHLIDSMGFKFSH